MNRLNRTTAEVSLSREVPSSTVVRVLSLPTKHKADFFLHSFLACLIRKKVCGFRKNSTKEFRYCTCFLQHCHSSNRIGSADNSREQQSHMNVPLYTAQKVRNVLTIRVMTRESKNRMNLRCTDRQWMVEKLAH